MESIAVELHSFHCHACGTYFAIDEKLWQSRRTVGGNFYCPNGHPMVSSEWAAKQNEQQAKEIDVAALRATAARLTSQLDQRDAKVEQLKKRNERLRRVASARRPWWVRMLGGRL